MTATDIEIACAKHFNLRQNIIVPNVSWGLGLHECDLLILTKSGYAYEVEIKVSMSDLKADLKKKHKHENNRIKKLYFAVPESLYPKCVEFIPEIAGIITVGWCERDDKIKATLRQEAKIKGNYKLTDKQRIHLCHLGCERIWTLKKSQRKHAWSNELLIDKALNVLNEALEKENK